jgi:histidine triad (HIT) family protein
MGEPTLFERILAGEIPGNFVARGDLWGAFLDVFPRRSGHTLVVPKRPVQHLKDLPVEELAALMEGVQETQKRLSKYFGTNDFSIIIHDGPIAGQEISHVHIHVIPRTKGDGGRSLLSMWPNAPAPSGAPEFDKLSQLCKSINEA